MSASEKVHVEARAAMVVAPLRWEERETVWLAEDSDFEATELCASSRLVLEQAILGAVEGLLMQGGLYGAGDNAFGRGHKIMISLCVGLADDSMLKKGGSNGKTT